VKIRKKREKKRMKGRKEGKEMETREQNKIKTYVWNHMGKAKEPRKRESK
jgi:hypothetical protein